MSAVAAMRGTRGHVCDVQQGLRWIDALLGAAGGFLELRVTHQDGSPGVIVPPAGGRWLAHYVGLCESIYADVEVGLARPKRGWGSTSRVPVLWVRLEGKKQAEKLRRFRPVPTIVVREGDSSRYTGLWALTRPVKAWEDVVRANERLAHALGAPRKYADPDAFYFPAPGSVLRAGRRRPCPVMLARCGLETYTPMEVVGHLRDAPDRDAWMTR